MDSFQVIQVDWIYGFESGWSVRACGSHRHDCPRPGVPTVKSPSRRDRFSRDDVAVTGAPGRLVTVVLEVADLDRALSLYRVGFGLDLHLADHEGAGHGETDRWISGRHAATTWHDGAFLHFALYESKGRRTSGVQVSFTVEDLEVAHGRAVEAGALVLHEPRLEPWGRSARYQDLDGNVVELTQRVAT